MMRCTDEEIDRAYEEFYEDVHTEFLKFGEIVNFKACRNGSVHLRGNVYVHYKSLESAILAYQTVNGRYFAGKQITCEYVGVTKWRVAICGEYMKSRLKTCSRGAACNFIHCFRNPGGDYEWADWDNPPPMYWVKKMAALFGPSDEVGYDKQWAEESLDQPMYIKKLSEKHERYHSRRSRSRDNNPSISSSSGGEDAGGRRDQRSTPSNRKMKLSIDHREEDSYLEDDRYEKRNILRDYGCGDQSNNTDRCYSHSSSNAHRHSKEQSHSHSHENSRKKYSCNESNEEKDRSRRRGSHREYDDLRRGRKRSYSSKWAHASDWRKTDHNEHKKSENHESDGPHSDNRRHKSQESSFGPNSSDPSERWEAGSGFHDEREVSRSPNFEESLSHMHRPNSQRSSGHDYGMKSRTQSSHRAHSGRRKDEKDASSDDVHSVENLEHYNGRERIYKNHKEKRKRPNEDEDISSGESEERSEVEQRETRDPLKHKCDLRRKKHRDRSNLQEVGSKRSRDYIKRKYENDKDEVCDAHELKSRRRSRRSKSR